jgi:NAD(P)H-nitrite reductase large subunit
VVGGGVLGIEAADALRQLGVAVTLVAREPRLMSGVLDDQASAILVRFLERAGIAVRLADHVAEVLADDAGRVRGVSLAGGDEIACELIVTCIGTIPNVDLARSAGLTIGRGIIVDASMRTSDPAIIAVGDVAEVPGAVSGLWPIGKKQGEIAAAAIAGDEVAYVQAHTMMHVKLAGIDVKCFGDVSATSDEHRHFTGTSDPDSRWRRVVVHRGRIVAGVFIGEAEMARDIGRAVAGEADHATVITALQSGDWQAAGVSTVRGEASTPAVPVKAPLHR